MAKGYYQNMYENLFGNSGLASKYYKKADTASTAYKVGKLQKQIDNKKTRMEAEGVDTSTDDRNALEKFLGLPEDQNVIFDIFELIGRPQQAIFGAIDAAQKGEDAWEGAKQGFSGEKYTYGGELLRNAGMKESGEGEGLFGSSVGWDDVLGFGLDVFADPADLIPVAGFGKAAKVLKNGGKLTDAIKATDTATDLIFKGAGKAIKGGAKLADNSVEAALKLADKTGANKILYDAPKAIDAANLGKHTINELGQRVSTDTLGKLELYKGIKNQVSSMFKKNSKLTDNAVNAIRKTDADTVRAAKELEPIYNNLNDKITKYAKKAAKKSGDNSAEAIQKLVNEVDVDLSLLKEANNVSRKVTGADLINEAKNGTLSYKAIGDEGVELLNKIADPVNKADKGLKLTVNVGDDGIVKLSDDWDKVEDFNLNLDDAAKKAELTKKSLYTKADEKKIKALNKKLNPKSKFYDADFKKLYDETEGVFNEFNSVINKHFKTNLPTGSDNLGYVRHAYNKELFGTNDFSGYMNKKYNFIGDTRVLGDRKWNMSAREANNMFNDIVGKNMDNLSPEAKSFVKNMQNKGLFKEGMFASMDSYLNDIPNLAKNNNVLNEVLVKSTFGDFNKIEELNSDIVKARAAAHKAGALDGMSDEVRQLMADRATKLDNSNLKVLTEYDNAVPKGFTRLDKNTSDALLKKMERLNNEFGTGQFNEVISNIRKSGENIAINNDILRLVDINLNNKEAGALTRLYDKFLNSFKKFKVLSPTFQMNNIMGNMSNMYLAGISPTTMARLYPEAANIVHKGSKLVDDVAKGVKISASDKKILETYYRFMDAGFGDANKLLSSELADIPEGLKRYFKDKTAPKGAEIIKDGLPWLNAKMNDDMDTVSRMVTFLYGERNPGFLAKLGVDDAGAAVRKVNFDPSDLTEFEKAHMKRIMPFYTFTKKNLAFQIDNLSKNGSNYHKLLKTYNANLKSTLGDDEENVPRWLKNNLYITIPGLTKDGKYTVLRTQMPLGNLIETVDDPLSSGVGMLAPWLKAPTEILSNKNFFTGADLQKYKGEKSSNIPGLTKMQEYLLGTFTGLDVPVKSIARIAQGDDLLSGLGNTVSMERDVEVDRMNKMYEELNELETMMQQYKQMGYEFSTINELKKANTNATVDNIMSKLNKFNGIKQNPYGNLK